MIKNQLQKPIAEFFIVFLSVVLAFFFEDYRENRKEKSQYINTLLNLRNDIQEDVYDFRLNADTSVGRYSYLCSDTAVLGAVLRYIKNKEEGDSIPSLLSSQFAYTNSKWRFQSAYLKEVNQFSEFIEKDSLRSIISDYNAIFIDEFVHYEELNEEYKKNREFLMNNFDFSQENLSRKWLDNYVIRNRIFWINNLTQSAIFNDLECSKDLSEIVREIDKRLHKHGIDTSKLDKQWLVQ